MNDNSKLKKGSASNKQKYFIEEQTEENYSIFLAQANIKLDQTDYYRGISYNTLNKYGVGYDPEWKHPEVVKEYPNVPATPRLIIPTSDYSYLARDTRKPEEIPEEQQKYKKSKVGKTHIFNLSVIKRAQKPIFVVEGELDALSILDVNGEALALGSCSMVNKFIEYLQNEQKPAHTLLIAMDSDRAGENAKILLIKELDKLGLDYTVVEPYKNFKDANEALMTDRAGFSVYVAKYENFEKDRYIRQNSTTYYINDFLNDITDSINTPAISTGFNKLDKVLGGGLYEGLYTIGAVSSLGKTTFIMQIASEIAKRGQDVLIFSLEMARSELIAKLISKNTAQLAQAKKMQISEYAKTTRQITVGSFYKYYTPSQKQHINESVEELGKYSDHLFIEQGIGDIGVTQVKAIIENHKNALDRKPVVIVDYLQILAPYNDHWSEKQNTNKTVMELKRISRDSKIPVIVISSFNRANYQSEAKEEAFKESGGIEYSSDVLLGLQYKGAGEVEFKLNAAKKKNPREIELAILKNRNGEVGDKIEYKYYPAYNYFIEQEF